MAKKSWLSCGTATLFSLSVMGDSPFLGKENNYFELNLVSGEKAKKTTEIKVLILDFKYINKTLFRS
ncbi:MAG: hypothetical protein ACJA1Z_003594 [Patiriisocius sp.]|jgi:hypothetical protein